jgi:hypothetical protein
LFIDESTFLAILFIHIFATFFLEISMRLERSLKSMLSISIISDSRVSEKQLSTDLKSVDNWFKCFNQIDQI